MQTNLNFIFLYLLRLYAHAQTVNEIDFNLEFAGAGQTAALYRQMALLYPKRANRGVQTASISYEPFGTAYGLQRLVQDQVLVACSLNTIPQDMTGLTAIPQAAGAIVMVYHRASFPSLGPNDRLVFPYDLPIKIYLKQVTMWNDELIQRANPNVTLPNQPIKIVAANDTQGGATAAMRKTFSLINSTWTATGPNDPWPYYDYLVNDENSMIAQVTLTPFTVGFSGFEQAVSTGIAFAAIKNQAGKVVTPSTESATAAMESLFGPNMLRYDRNFIGGDIVNSPDPKAYPYLFFYYAVMKNGTDTDCRRRRESLRFVYWRLTDKDSIRLVENAGFTPLTQTLNNLAIELAKTITCDGERLYGASPCDSGCANGQCFIDGMFHPPEDVCECDSFHRNVDKTDCSELFLDKSDDNSTRLEGTEFTMQFAGAPQTATLYSQMAMAYPTRPNSGFLKAGISYVASGTVPGIEQMIDDNFLVACSLNTIPDDMTDLVALPQAGGSLVIIYNKNSFPSLSNTQRLIFPHDLIVKIYLGQVTRWNDPIIQEANPTVRLPNRKIIVIAAADTKGGATGAMRGAFNKIDPRWNATKPEDPWPYYDVLAKNERELMSIVTLTPFSIGFGGFETAVATDTAFATIKNRRGRLVTPSRATITDAINHFLGPSMIKEEQNHIGGSIVNADSDNAYPYVFFYYAITKNNAKSQCRERREALRFVHWRLTAKESITLVENAGFTPLPNSWVDLVLNFARRKISCQDQPLFGASPCDTGCFAGRCQVVGLWNPPEDICDCDVFHINVNKRDCSEERPLGKGTAVESDVKLDFSISFAGSSQTASLYRQLSVVYPARAKKGVQTASIDYENTGTGAGLQKLYRGEVIAVSALNQLPTDSAKYMAIPQFVGSMVMIYNRQSFSLPPGQKLVFPYDLAVRIYLGEITRWNDEYIQKANPGVDLPDKQIIVVAGTDKTSGPTVAIRAAFKEIDVRWNATRSSDLWPYYSMLAASQNELVSTVMLTPYSIGYTGYEQAIATESEYAIIRNSAGKEIIPNVKSITAALEYFTIDSLFHFEANYVGGNILNARAPEAYPYSFFYYYVTNLNATDSCRQRREGLRFIHWLLTSPDAQRLVENAGFKSLPLSATGKILELAQKARCDGQPLYGASPCDRGCVGGTCEVEGMFHAPEDICKCGQDFVNENRNDCSEARQAEFVAISSPVGSAITAFSVIFAAYTALLMGLIYYNRKVALIKALSPMFCIITLVGLLFEFVGIFVLVGQPSNVSCSLQMWFVSLPLAVIFAAIIVKQYRLVTVFQNKSRAALGIRNSHLFGLIGLIVLPCVIILGLYSAVVDPQASRVLNLSNEYAWTCSAAPGSESAQIAVFVVLGLYHIIQVGFSLFLAVQGRNIRDEFNESQAIRGTVYILSTVGVLTVIILAFPQLPFRARFVIRSVGILLSSLLFTIILFLKPLRAILIRKDGDTEKGKSGGGSGTAGTGEGKLKMINKDGVMIAESVSTEATDHSDTSDEELDDSAGPVKKIKEDAFKWHVFARPKRFLEAWRNCFLTFHRELATISIIQRHGIKDRSRQSLTVCFPLKTIKLFYRGYNVTGNTSGSGSGFKFMKTFDAISKKMDELEAYVLEFHVSNGDVFAVQMKSIKQAEQVVGLFTGSSLKETTSQVSSRRGSQKSQSKLITDRDDDDNKAQHHSNHNNNNAPGIASANTKKTKSLLDEDESDSHHAYSNVGVESRNKQQVQSQTQSQSKQAARLMHQQSSGVVDDDDMAAGSHQDDVDDDQQQAFSRGSATINKL